MAVLIKMSCCYMILIMPFLRHVFGANASWPDPCCCGFGSAKIRRDNHTTALGFVVGQGVLMSVPGESNVGVRTQR